MKRVYRCFSSSAAHQWMNRNIHPHEEKVPYTTSCDEVGSHLEGAFNKMAVVSERVRVPFENSWRWRQAFSVFHSENDGGGRQEIDLIMKSND